MPTCPRLWGSTVHKIQMSAVQWVSRRRIGNLTSTNWKSSFWASGNVSGIKRRGRAWARMFLSTSVLNPVCVCVYLQVVVVLLAAAVKLFSCALVQVENGAQVAEKSWFRDHKFLTWTGRVKKKKTRKSYIQYLNSKSQMMFLCILLCAVLTQRTFGVKRRKCEVCRDTRRLGARSLRFRSHELQLPFIN